MSKRLMALLLGLALTSSAALSQEPSLKLTTGVYALSGGALPSSHGLDVNLRQSSQWGNIWGAWYRSPEAQVSQPRMGWDHSFDMPRWRVMPSLQIASGGFVGGSLSLETGETLFAGVGLGRTNLRPYVNLNPLSILKVYESSHNVSGNENREHMPRHSLGEMDGKTALLKFD